jgi:hypothetical protein
MSSALTLEEANTLRARLNNTIYEINIAIEEFNKRFETSIDQIATFGDGDVDRTTANNALSEIKTIALLNQSDGTGDIRDNSAFYLWSAVQESGAVDSNLDRNNPETRRGNIIQSNYENIAGSVFDFYDKHPYHNRNWDLRRDLPQRLDNADNNIIKALKLIKHQ